MKYNFNGKTLNIPDDELQISMKNLELTKEEAIQMYLEDNDYLDNAEQDALDEKAKKERITATIHQASSVDKNTPRKKRVVQKKEDPVKKDIIQKLKEFLENYGAEDVCITNETKLVTFKVGCDTFKLDLIRTREKK